MLEQNGVKIWILRSQFSLDCAFADNLITGSMKNRQLELCFRLTGHARAKWSSNLDSLYAIYLQGTIRCIKLCSITFLHF